MRGRYDLRMLSPIIFGNHRAQDKWMRKLFDERHLLFWAIYIAFMLLFAEIVSQVYEDKFECESVAASLLIKWKLIPAEFWVKDNRVAESCGHLYKWAHPFSNELHLPR
jgi:hypothetical protein